MNQVLRLTHAPVAPHPLPEARAMRPAERLEPGGRIRPRPQDGVSVGGLSHLPHEDLGPAELANAQRRRDFYSRWRGLTAARLTIWKAS